MHYIVVSVAYSHHNIEFEDDIGVDFVANARKLDMVLLNGVGISMYTVACTTV